MPRQSTEHEDEYIRIRPDILNTVKEKVKTEKPEKVYEDMDLIDGPRNSKQVKNAKYRVNRKEQQTIGRRDNFTDQVKSVEMT